MVQRDHPALQGPELPPDQGADRRHRGAREAPEDRGREQQALGPLHAGVLPRDARDGEKAVRFVRRAEREADAIAGMEVADADRRLDGELGLPNRQEVRDGVVGDPNGVAPGIDRGDPASPLERRAAGGSCNPDGQREPERDRGERAGEVRPPAVIHPLPSASSSRWTVRQTVGGLRGAVKRLSVRRPPGLACRVAALSTCLGPRTLAGRAGLGLW